MAITLTISQNELQRQAALAFEGQTYEVFLANNSGSLTANSTYAAWQAVELASANGYAPVTGTIGTGAWSSANARYELPAITATFTSSGSGLSYDTICVRLGTETYLHSILIESPSVTLAAGQAKSYVITLVQDD
ncbi:MAG: hypothetical protein ACO3GP_01685 [Candidatus Limnocylindrus sp.]